MSAAADARAAAELLALDPQGLGGAVLQGPPGPARDAWLAHFRAALPLSAPVRQAPANTDEDRLLGGLDLAASLAARRPIAAPGLLAETDGGALVVSGAERLDARGAALLVSALDVGEITLARDGVSGRFPARAAIILLEDARSEEEGAPEALLDRLAFRVDVATPRLEALPPAAPALRPANVAAPSEAVIEALVKAAGRLGIASPRAPLLALKAARAAAARAGRRDIDTEDLALAARLVLAPRATQSPAPADDPPTPDDTPPPDGESDGGETQSGDPDALTDVMVAAARAVLPEFPSSPANARRLKRVGEAGRGAGPAQPSLTRGRRIRARQGAPAGGARIDLMATLRAAAPWQGVRRRESPGREGLHVRRGDLHVQRRLARAKSCVIFVVDASGSAALHRLAEAKGAVELLLARSYVERSEAALIAFRGRLAEVALPPTRSVSRARRRLCDLAGGGGTPLAAALEAATRLAEQERRRGRAVRVVLLSDGSANVTRAGVGDRATAQAEALTAAKAVRAAELDMVFIDTAVRPRPENAALAAAMGARYAPLPRVDAAGLAALVTGA